MATNPLFKPKKPQDLEFEKNENSAALRVNKQVPQADQNKVQWPTLQTLKTKPMRGGYGAHLPPEVEPMLPGDDLGEFFKERAVVEHTRQMQFKRRKSQIWGLLFALSVVFVLAYSFVKPARELTHTSIEKLSNLKNSKKINLLSNLQNKESDSKNKVSPLNSIDSQILMIRLGRWKEVEQKLSGQCSIWAASTQCIAKGYFLIYRHKFNLAKPLFSLNPTEVAKLPALERALWHFSLSILEANETAKIVQLKTALNLTNTNTLKDTRKRILDDFIVLSVKDSYFKPAQEALKFAQQDALLKADEPLLAKWQVLSTLNTSKEWPQTVLSQLFKSGPNRLSSDPLAFSLLATTFIKSGKTALLTKVANAMSTSSAVNGLDQEYQRNILQASVRIFWAQGMRAEAMERLGRYPNIDEFYKHFSAVNYSLSSSKESFKRGYDLLKENSINRGWETFYLKGTLAVKLNLHKEASQSYNEILLNKNPAAKFWSTILLADIYTAQRKFKEAQKTLAFITANERNRWQYLEALRKVYDGLGQEKDSSKLRLKLDAIKGQAGYWSSNEMLSAPVGALALTSMR